MSEQVTLTAPIKLSIRSKDSLDLLSKYVRILSNVAGQPITDTELAIMIVLINNHDGVLTADARKDVKLRLDMSIANINNYIGRIRSKGLIVEQNDIEMVHPLLTKFIGDGQQVNITFKKA